MIRYLDHIKSSLLSLGDYLNIKLSGAGAMALYGFFFGVDLQAAMISLIALMTFDLVTGTMVAWKEENISSRRAAKTPIKFGLYCMLVSAAHLTDVAVFHGLYLEEAMIAFLAVTELISILENIGKIGYAIPKKLLRKLENFRDSK